MSIPIVFITGHVKSSLRGQTQKWGGVVEILEKPFDGDAFLEAVERAMRAGARRPLQPQGSGLSPTADAG